MNEKELICAALGWDDTRYHMNVYESGMAYLDCKVSAPRRVKLIAETRTYWIWWKRQYEYIDRALIHDVGLHEDVVDCIGAELRMEMQRYYEERHAPEEMKVYISTAATRAIEAEINGKLTIK